MKVHQAGRRRRRRRRFPHVIISISVRYFVARRKMKGRRSPTTRDVRKDDDDDDDDDDDGDDDDDDDVFNPIERFQQSRGETNASAESSASKEGVKKLKFVIKPLAPTSTQTATGTMGEDVRKGTVQSTREKFEKFALKPPPGFVTSISSPSSSSPKTPTSSFMALEGETKGKEKEVAGATTATATATAAADDHDDDEIKEINEDWLTHGNDAWQETRNEVESKREEEYVEELTHTAKKKYGKYAFVEEASSPSGILSDLHVAEPLEFDSVKTKVRATTEKESSNGRKDDFSESFLLESSMENDPFKSNAEYREEEKEEEEHGDAQKLETKNTSSTHFPNEDQVAHAKVLLQAGITKFNSNDLRGALYDFQNACILLRDNYHSGDIVFAKTKTHLVAVFLILKCEENKANVDLCAKFARTLATVTYMADESVFGGFSQQFLLSPKLICRCLRFASAKNFNAKHYGAAKEYLEILLKPFFCADSSTKAALTGMKRQCENAKKQHGTKKVDEAESQKRVLDIIDELLEEAFAL